VELVVSAEIRVVASADDMFNTVLVDSHMTAEAQATVHMAVVLSVEQAGCREDREVAEHP
jgi:uncharacterized lipoprotein YajG